MLPSKDPSRCLGTRSCLKNSAAPELIGREGGGFSGFRASKSSFFWRSFSRALSLLTSAPFLPSSLKCCLRSKASLAAAISAFLISSAPSFSIASRTSTLVSCLSVKIAGPPACGGIRMESGAAHRARDASVAVRTVEQGYHRPASTRRLPRQGGQHNVHGLLQRYGAVHCLRRIGQVIHLSGGGLDTDEQVIPLRSCGLVDKDHNDVVAVHLIC